MGLRDELAPPRQRGGTCSVRLFVEGEQAAEWIELLDDASVETMQLWRLMKAKGFARGYETVKHHRRGECRCGKSPR